MYSEVLEDEALGGEALWNMLSCPLATGELKTR